MSHSTPPDVETPIDIRDRIIAFGMRLVFVLLLGVLGLTAVA